MLSKDLLPFLILLLIGCGKSNYNEIVFLNTDFFLVNAISLRQEINCGKNLCQIKYDISSSTQFRDSSFKMRFDTIEIDSVILVRGNGNSRNIILNYKIKNVLGHGLSKILGKYDCPIHFDSATLLDNHRLIRIIKSKRFEEYFYLNSEKISEKDSTSLNRGLEIPPLMLISK
jgi:hypothetical protein